MPEAEKRYTREERRRLAEERDEKLARRTTPIFMITKPIKIGPTEARTVRGVLVPNLDLKHSAGPYASRKIIEQLRNALAVHAVLAYYALVPLGERTTQAQQTVAKTAGKSWYWLRQVARTNLSELTHFPSARQARRWAVDKINRMRAEGAISSNREDKVAIERELEAVRLLSFAEHWAEKIVDAYEDVQRLQERAQRRGIDVGTDRRIQDASHERVQSAANEPGWDCPYSDLLQIAMHADINPSCLWMNTVEHFSLLFEVARFIGRIHAGREATLQPDSHELVRHLFGQDPVYDFQSGEVAATVVRHHLRQLFQPERFLPMLATADDCGKLLTVTASREIVLTEAPAIPQELPRRAYSFFERLAEKCKEFFRLNPRYRQGRTF